MDNHNSKTVFGTFSRILLVINAICLLATYMYVHFGGAVTGDVLRLVLPMLLIGDVLLTLIYFNFLWFISNHKQMDHRSARTLFRLFAVATLLLMFIVGFRSHYFSPQIVI